MTNEEKYVLSTYKEMSIIAESEFKTIWIVKNEATDTLYVKKILRDTYNFDFYKRLVGLGHKNLAKVHNVFMGDGEIYVIEDYVNGHTLKSALEQDGVLPETKVLNYVLQICEALSYLHGQNPPIIHRDVKPENVICSTDSIIKLVDFDIAREFKKAVNRDTAFMGTKEYAAPEQYGYKQTDCRTDIYAVGVLIHELVTGELPQNNIAYKGKLRKVIQKCLQLDPEKRYQNVLELKNALGYKYFIPHKKIIPALAVVSFACFVCWAVYTLIDTAPTEPLSTPELQAPEPARSAMRDFFDRIVSGYEKPSILLESEAIRQTIENITGGYFDEVIGALQEYMFWESRFSHYDPAYDLIVVPACNHKDGYAHDMLMLETNGKYMSLLYRCSDREKSYYFTTLDDKGRLTPSAFGWAQSRHFLNENPIIFQEEDLSRDDIAGVYMSGKKRIEIFEDGEELKFSFTDATRSPYASQSITAAIQELDSNHYWIRNAASGNKNRLVFNFSKNHLTLLSDLYYEGIYLQGIYEKE